MAKNAPVHPNAGIHTAILLGLLECTAGLLVLLIPSAAAGSNTPLAAWQSSFLSDLGTGLIAAGLITATLETLARRRTRADVEEIRGAHAESVLKGLIPEPIFQEVQAHIIREPFLRTNFHIHMELTWTDTTRRWLHRTQTVTYTVHSASRTTEVLKVRTFEERVHEDKFPNSTVIEEIAIQQSDQAHPIAHKGSDLVKYLDTNAPHLVQALIPVELKPEQDARITSRRTSILADRGVYPYVVTIPTVNLDITVAHPSDCAVQAIPLHPSPRAFIQEMDAPGLKHWRIEAGLLPYQGIELTWRPAAPSSGQQHTGAHGAEPQMVDMPTESSYTIEATPP